MSYSDLKRKKSSYANDNQHQSSGIPQLEYEEHDEEINLLEYWYVVKRRSGAIIGLSFIMALIGILVAFTITPQYQSTVKILVEPDAPKVVSLDPLQSGSNIMYFYQTQYDIISSRSVVASVIKKLKLEQHPVFLKAIPALTGEETGISIWRSMISDTDTLAIDVAHQQQLLRDAIIEYVLEHLEVKGQKNSQIINISYESPDAHLSASIANTISDAYIEKGFEAKLALNKKASDWLTNRIAGLRQKLETSEERLRRYQQEESMVDTESFASMTSSKLGGITDALIKAQARRAETEIRFQQVQEAKKNGKNPESLPFVLQNKFIQTLKEEHAKLARYVSELSERYGEKHPKMIAATSDLQTTNLRLSHEVDKIIDGTKSDYEAAVSSVKKLQALSQQTEKEARSYQSKEFQLAKLERDVATNRQLYDVFMTRFKETSMTGDSGVTNVSIVDFARPALLPSKPKKKLIVAAATFAGLFLGVLLAFLLEYLENTFRIPEDVEQKLGLPLLGLLPLLPGNQISSPERHSYSKLETPAFSEALNNIRTGVMFANIDEPVKMIMVTSSVANEGKTTLCSNLSLTFSHTGKTLLIDGDLRKQQFSNTVLSQSRKMGMAELASGDATLDDCIVQDDKVSNLYYMSSGLATPKPLELLSSKRFSDMLDLLRINFEHIIIDSAPLLPVSDSLIIANLVDEVIMVVKADSTTHKIAQDAVKRLATAHVKPLGVVLQQADLEKIESYGSYSYGYGYGYGSESTAT